MNELRPRSSQKNDQGGLYSTQQWSGGAGNVQTSLGGGGKPPLRDPQHRTTNMPEETVKIINLDAQNLKARLPARAESLSKSKHEGHKEEFFLNQNTDSPQNRAHGSGSSHNRSMEHGDLQKKPTVSGHSAIPINNFNFFMKNNGMAASNSKRGDPPSAQEAGIGCLGTATTGKATLSTQQTRGGLGPGLKGHQGVYSQDYRHQSQLAEDLKLLNALKVNLALGAKACPTLRECYLVPEQELTRGLQPTPVNLDRVFSQYDAGSFDQWHKDMQAKLQSRLNRKLLPSQQHPE